MRFRQVARGAVTACAVAVSVATAAGSALADKLAFVAATNDYANVPRLRTAVADGTAMAKQLGEIGFKVSLHKDATSAQFDEAWREFLSSVKSSDEVVFYFAGHGLQIDGANYLLPRNAPGADTGQAAFIERSIDFTQIVEALQVRQPRAAVYILDACRNDPYQDAGRKRSKDRPPTSKGLARIEKIYNAFVMYAAAANEEVSDAAAHNGANSIYIHHLLPLLSKSELSLVDTAKRVQVAVATDTASAQKPDYFDGILGQYFLAGAGLSGAAAGAVAGDVITGPNVVRLGGFATWDGSCQSRPAPRIAVTDRPSRGSIVLRYEAFTAAGSHFGVACAKSKQRGVGVYYVVDAANAASTDVDRVKFTVKHWSAAPATSVDETFEVDLATRYSRRVTARQNPKN